MPNLKSPRLTINDREEERGRGGTDTNTQNTNRKINKLT